MMVEIWWKVFAIGLAIAIVLKLAGVSTAFPILLLGAVVLVFLFFVVSMAVQNARDRRAGSK